MEVYSVYGDVGAYVLMFCLYCQLWSQTLQYLKSCLRVYCTCFYYVLLLCVYFRASLVGLAAFACLAFFEFLAFLAFFAFFAAVGGFFTGTKGSTRHS